MSAEEKSKAMFSTGMDVEAGPGKSAGAAPGGSSVQDTLFVYQETEEDLLGPHIPDIGGLGEGGYLQHIKSVLLILISLNHWSHLRSASEAEKAGGYVESLGCYRALQEAMAGLYFVPGKS